MEQKPKKARKKKETYETLFKRLEETVQQMEDGELALESALDLYEQGVTLIRQCSQKLDEAEKRIELLTRDDKDQITVTIDRPEKYQPGE